MPKELLKCFIVSWFGYLIFLLLAVTFGVFYYPIHSWLFADQWRWDSFERTMRFYKVCVPASFFVALIVTFAEWTKMRKKDKKPD